MTLQADVLSDSLDLLFNREPDFTHHFYRLLMARHPESQRMFELVDMEAQEVKLSEMLVLLVRQLENDAWVMATLKELGRDHVKYGVTAEMYPWVAQCLLDTAKACCGEDWTSEINAAWSDALTVIASVMLEGVRGAAAA